MTTDTSHTVVAGDETPTTPVRRHLPRPTRPTTSTSPTRHDGDPHSLIHPEGQRPPTAIEVLTAILERDGSQQVRHHDRAGALRLPRPATPRRRHPLSRRPRLRRGADPGTLSPSSTSTARSTRSGRASPTSPHTPPSAAHSRSAPSTAPTRSTCFSTRSRRPPRHRTRPRRSPRMAPASPRHSGPPPLAAPHYSSAFPPRAMGPPSRRPATNGSATSPTRSVMKARHDPPRPPIRGPRNWSPRPTRTCSAMWRSGARRSA